MNLAVIGSAPMDQGISIVAAHIDSPRLDLKPSPLYEESEMAFLKTHYYGGIRKYQWVTIPLELRGVVAKKDGTMTEDDVSAAEKTIQDVTDKFIKKVDVLTSAKEKELMAI